MPPKYTLIFFLKYITYAHIFNDERKLLKTSCVFLKRKDENDGRRHCQFYIKIKFACISLHKFLK